MPDAYTQSYETLGLRPEAGWKELKLAYRRRVREWHPDRFQGDDQRKKRADEKTKAINSAYKELSDYYRRHGALPLQMRRTAPTPPRYESPVDPAPTRRRAWLDLAEAFGIAALGTRRVFFVLAAVLMLGAYIVLTTLPFQNQKHSRAHSNAPAAPASNLDTRTPPSAAARPEAPFFTTGSTIGEVYSAQGVPSKTENDIWHYGNSKVYFTNGVVLKWESTPENPLNARIDRGPDRAPVLITRGSTKSDVRQIQGSPVREADKVWDYGISRVYFEGDRVVDWYESPLNPLQVKR